MDNNEIENLRDDFNSFQSNLYDKIEKQEKQARNRRIENVQVLIALGIFGAFSTGYSDDFLDPLLESVFVYLGWFSILYLFIKITTISLRPLFPSKRNPRTHRLIAFADNTILSILFVVLFYSSIFLVFLDQLPDIQDKIIENFSIEMLFWLQIIIWAIVGYLYSRKIVKTMGIQSSSTDTVSIFPSGTSDSTLEFLVENPFEEPIQSGEIEFIIDSPPGINIERVHPAKLVGGLWQTVYSIPPKQPMRFTIDISSDNSEVESGEHSIDVKIKYNQEIQSTESLSFRV